MLQGPTRVLLTLTDEHNLVSIDVFLLLEVGNDFLQCVLLVSDRHFHGVVVALAMNASAWEVEGIDSITKVVERLEIVFAEMVCAVESMADDGDTRFFSLSISCRVRVDTINALTILLFDSQFLAEPFAIALYCPFLVGRVCSDEVGGIVSIAFQLQVEPVNSHLGE